VTCRNERPDNHAVVLVDTGLAPASRGSTDAGKTLAAGGRGAHSVACRRGDELARLARLVDGVDQAVARAGELAGTVGGLLQQDGQLEAGAEAQHLDLALRLAPSTRL